MFWLHIASLAASSALVGYLLHREVMTTSALACFTVAMALHFFVTDYSLNEDHQERYRSIGRWLRAAAVLLGLGAGVATEISDAAVAVLTAFLAGRVILDVLDLVGLPSLAATRQCFGHSRTSGGVGS